MREDLARMDTMGDSTDRRTAPTFEVASAKERECLFEVKRFFATLSLWRTQYGLMVQIEDEDGTRCLYLDDAEAHAMIAALVAVSPSAREAQGVNADLLSPDGENKTLSK